MPNKTIYITEEFIPIWEKAARYANALGTSLSSVIMDKLWQYLDHLPCCQDCGLKPLLPEWKFCPQCEKRFNP